MIFKNKIYKGLQYFRTEVVKCVFKGPGSNILGFVGHAVFVPTTQLCLSGTKADTDNTLYVLCCALVNLYGCALVNFYLY